MGQGQVAQPTVIGPHPAFEGVMNALKAVHEYYGIDTEKAQQKLMAAQELAAQADTEAKKAGLPGIQAESQSKGLQLQSLQDKAMGKVTPLNAGEWGLIPDLTSASGVQSSGSPLATAAGKSTAPATQRSFTIQTDSGPKKYQLAPDMAKKMNDVTIGDQTIAKNEIEKTNLGLDTQSKRQGLVKGTQEIAKGDIGVTEAQNSGRVKAYNKFGEIAKDGIDAQRSLSIAKDTVNSSEPISRNASLAATQDLLGTYKRISVESGHDMAEPVGAVRKFIEGITKAQSGDYLTDSQRKDLASLIDKAAKANSNLMKVKADTVAKEFAPETHYGKDWKSLSTELLGVGQMEQPGESPYQAQPKPLAGIFDANPEEAAANNKLLGTPAQRTPTDPTTAAQLMAPAVIPGEAYATIARGAGSALAQTAAKIGQFAKGHEQLIKLGVLGHFAKKILGGGEK